MPDERTIKVLHVTTESSKIAGAERVIIELARGARRRHWNLEFVTLRPEGPLNKSLLDSGWPVRSLGLDGWGGLPSAARSLRARARLFEPDFVHAHLTHAAILCAFALPSQTAVLQTRHYAEHVRLHGGALARTLDRLAARRCIGIASVSEAARRELVEVEGVASNRVRVIPNSVDTDQLASFGRTEGRRLLRQLGVVGDPILGCLATLHPQKGHRVLIDALAQLRNDYPGAALVLLGDGHDGVALKDYVARKGLTGSVVFLGHRCDATELAAGFDVYVQPSLGEAFGLAVVEAMALGLPVVASCIGGMTETVVHDETGLLVPAGEPGPLRQALRRVLESPMLREKLASRGRERARTLYALETMIEGYDRWYRELLAPLGRSPGGASSRD